jgi:DNA replication protein DnaC
MSHIESLPLLLKQLALPSISHHWESKAREGEEKHWPYAQYLSVLAELEVGSRYEKRVQRHIKESKLPVGKTLASFQFDKAKSINAAQIQALADNTSWVKQASNLIIFGPSGVGKSHIAAAIGYRLIEQGLRVLFVSATTLVQKLMLAKNEYRLPDFLSKLSRIPVIILDDISYVKKTDVETGVLFELIAERYESNTLIITSNLPFGEWDQIFPDNIMAVAAIDRLVHHATIINVTDQSYRKAQAAEDNKRSTGGHMKKSIL